MNYTEDMKKDELVAAANLFIKAGIKWDHPNDAKQEGPNALVKADLIVWLNAMTARLGTPLEITQAWIEENPELGAKYQVGDVLLKPVEGAEEPAPPSPKPAPQATPGMKPVTAAQVKRETAALYLHGVKIRTVRNEIISGRVYKHVELENGVAYTMPLHEYETTVKAHE